jgi:hypothetical protein
MESIISFSPTISKLMGFSAPSLSTLRLLRPLMESVPARTVGRIEKCVLYSPDAIGMSLYQTYPGVFDPVLRYAPIQVPVRSVVPPKTPVCYASMFTGAMPEVHGTLTYQKNVVRCDTLFDALIRAGKRVAIVAVSGCSMDSIFRDRELDYFSESYDEDVTERTISLITSGNYDFIVAYHQGYDDALHETEPESGKAIEAMANHIASFVEIAGVIERNWDRHTSLIAFAPDHGAHTDSSTGKGTHGEDIPEDMNIMHFFGVINKRRHAWGA